MKRIYLTSILLLLVMYTFSQNNTCKCCTENHNQFNFWEGEWSVTNADGSLAGTNTITKVQGNCILQENWISNTPGYTGTSNNFYNAKLKRWEQIWIDNQGGSLHLKGNKIGNQMILKTDDEINKTGDTFYHQITWTKNDDGTVRQLWETFTKGKPVVVAFDGLYKRKR